MKKLIFVLMICSFFAATSVFGQNYGNFQANQYPGAANSSVILGSLPSTTPTARFYINTTTQNAAEINVTGSYLNGLRVTTNGYYSKGLFSQSTHPVSYAAYFEGHTYVSTKLGVGFSPLSMASHEKLAVRNGMITTEGTGNGFSLNGSISNSINDYGAGILGLFLGDESLINLSIDQFPNLRPTVLSGYYGLGFDVYGGKMAMCQNGAIYIGSNDVATINSIEDLADKAIADLEYRLYVEKGIRAEKVKVDVKAGNWPDFVFEEDYNLPSLTTIENYINKNKHLPNVPSAATVEKDGLDLAEMDKILLQKIEELTLYTIEQQKQIEALKKELKLLKQ